MKSPRVFLPAVLSGLLLWTAFFPLDLGPVAYVALAPLMVLVRAEGVNRWKRYAAALLGGLVFSLLSLKWIRVAHPMMEMFAWPALSLYMALYWPAALFLLRCLDTVPASVGFPLLPGDPRDGGRPRPPLALTLPVVWVALEYFRGHFPTGFPFLKWVGAYQPVGFGWYYLGYTQHRILPLTQAADLGGVYLISAMVASVNGATAEWLFRFDNYRRLVRMPTGWVPAQYYREFVTAAGAALFATGLMAYGTVRLVHPPFEPGPLVAAIQGNVSQSEKIEAREKQQDKFHMINVLERDYFRLAKKAVGDGTTRTPDLVVWPETCFPDNWNMTAPGLTPDPTNARVFRLTAENQDDFRAELRKKLPPVPMLLGLNRIEWLTEEDYRKFNSAMLLGPETDEPASYDKMHLVPFGEYVPLGDWFPWLQNFTPYSHAYSCTPGDRFTRFELPANGKTYRFGVLICYEDSDPDLTRRYNPQSGDGPGADFLVNISNDGWFDGTEEHEQHLAICRFRAVEARRSVVRAVNMGISAVIDPDGRVKALPETSWAASKKMAGVVRAEVPIDTRGSVYAAVGDWVPGLCWLLLVVAHFAARRART